jgi:hypothetical protein
MARVWRREGEAGQSFRLRLHSGFRQSGRRLRRRLFIGVAEAALPVGVVGSWLVEEGIPQGLKPDLWLAYETQG